MAHATERVGQLFDAAEHQALAPQGGHAAVQQCAGGLPGHVGSLKRCSHAVDAGAADGDFAAQGHVGQHFVSQSAPALMAKHDDIEEHCSNIQLR